MTVPEISRPDESEDLRREADSSCPAPTENHGRTNVVTPSPGDRGRISMESPPSDNPAILAPDVDGDEVAQESAETDQRAAEVRLLELARSDLKVLYQLRDTLIAYAQPLVEEKIANHDMWREAAQLVRVPAPVPTPPVCGPEETESLAAEVVTRAFERFCKHALHEWEPTPDLSLATRFYHDCLYQFANAIRAWSKHRRRLAPSLYHMLGFEEPGPPQTNTTGASSASATHDTETAARRSNSLDARLDDIERELGTPTRRLVEAHIVARRELAEVAGEIGVSEQDAHQLISRCRKVMINVWEGERT
jgi:hypothetical protein